MKHLYAKQIKMKGLSKKMTYWITKDKQVLSQRGEGELQKKVDTDGKVRFAFVDKEDKWVCDKKFTIESLYTEHFLGIKPIKMDCPSCKTKALPHAKFCHNCGHSLRD